MENYSIHLPSYTIGANAYDKVGEICESFGTKAVVIGGKKAMAAIKESLDSAVSNSKIDIVDYIWYGGEASYENIEALMNNENVIGADMIFAVGGGKATDTCKCLAVKMDKPVFSFPTIASNCSACTSVSIMYYPDGRFKEPFFYPAPPIHAFINTQLLVKSPAIYMWAGMGDTYAKYFEAEMSSRGEDLEHYFQMGVNASQMCYEPIMKYGVKGYESAKKGELSKEYEQVVLAIIVSTAVASIYLTAEHTVHYNSGLAHAIFYSLTAYPHIEKNHLHGEVVSFGVLNLLLVDNNMEDFKKVYDFSKAVELPVRLADLEFTAENIDELAGNAVIMKDVEHNAYPVTKEMLVAAMEQLEKTN